MTLGEIKVETLKKMFLNGKPIDTDHLFQYEKDKKYNTYLNMFNQALNEGLLICMKRGREIIKHKEIISDGINNKFDLKELCDGFYKIYKLYIGESQYTNYEMITDTMLKINVVPKDTIITIYYESYPELITEDTDEDYEIPNHIENLIILPLYIASELYKDDDISLATMYRNQFESQVDNKSSKDNKSKFVSVNGWY